MAGAATAAAGAGQSLGASLGTAPAGLVAGAATAAGAGESLGTSLGAAGAAELGTAWPLGTTQRARLAVLLLKARVLVGHAGMMLGIVLPLRDRGGTHEMRVIELVELHDIDLHVAEAPVVRAPQGRPHVVRRPEAPHRPDRPPRRIPEERHVSGRPIADAEDDHRIVDRHVNDFRLDRLDRDVLGHDHHLAAGRRRCRHPSHPLLLTGFQVAGGFRLGAQRLNRLGDVVRLHQEGFPELLGPIQLVVHHGQHLRNRRQALDARVPGLLLHGIFEILALEVRVVLGPPRGHHHFERIRGGRQNLRQQRVGVERHRGDELLQLLVAEPLLLLLLLLLLLVLGQHRQCGARQRHQRDAGRKRAALVSTIRPS